jgi:hypothetical protein
MLQLPYTNPGSTLLCTGVFGEGHDSILMTEDGSSVLVTTQVTDHTESSQKALFLTPA